MTPERKAIYQIINVLASVGFEGVGEEEAEVYQELHLRLCRFGTTEYDWNKLNWHLNRLRHKAHRLDVQRAGATE